MRAAVPVALGVVAVGSLLLSAPSGSGAVATGRIAFSDRLFPREGDNWEILVVDAEGGRLQNLTRDSSCDDIQPAWSRDGSQIAFVCRGLLPGGTRTGLWVMKADGTARHQLGRGAFESPSWSPDSRRLAFVRGGWIWTLRLADGRVRRLVRTDGFHSTWSRDGSWIAFNRTGRNGGIWRIHVGSGRLQRLTTVVTDHHAAWSPSGESIAFVRGRSIWIMGPDGRRERKAVGPVPAPAPLHGVPPESVEWSPDSRFFAFENSLPAVVGGGGGGLWTVGTSGQNPRQLRAGGQLSGASWAPARTGRS